MENNAAMIAKAYYTAIANKDIETVQKYIDPNIELSGPLSNVKGKEAMLAAIKGFMGAINTLTIRAVTWNQDQAMIAFDLDCPAPIGIVPSAAFMIVKNGLIVRNEIFFDARPFMQK